MIWSDKYAKCPLVELTAGYGQLVMKANGLHNNLPKDVILARSKALGTRSPWKIALWLLVNLFKSRLDSIYKSSDAWSQSESIELVCPRPPPLRTEKYETYFDDYCLALLLKGVCLRCRGQQFQASMCYQEILQSWVEVLSTYFLTCFDSLTC